MAAVGLIELAGLAAAAWIMRIEVFGDAGVTYANLTWKCACDFKRRKWFIATRWKSPSTKDGVIPFSKNFELLERRKNFALRTLLERQGNSPGATGEDGLVVMKASLCGIASAGECKEIALPFETRPT